MILWTFILKIKWFLLGRLLKYFPFFVLYCAEMPEMLPCPAIDNNLVDPTTLMPANSVYKPVFQLHSKKYCFFENFLHFFQLLKILFLTTFDSKYNYQQYLDSEIIVVALMVSIQTVSLQLQLLLHYLGPFSRTEEASIIMQ